MEGYVTLVELAARLGLKGVSGLRTQIHRGVLRAERVGSGQHAVWLVPEEEAARYEREHHVRNPHPRNNRMVKGASVVCNDDVEGESHKRSHRLFV
jgi:hypothetical protein